MAELFPKLRVLDGGFAKGATAIVKLYRAQDEKDSSTYAVKVIDMKRAAQDANFVAQVLREKQALESLCSGDKSESRCDFLVRYFGSCKDATSLYFILEFIQGGDLFRHIAAGPNSRLPKIYVQSYGLQVAHALRYLHRRGWVYRDLKANNVALSSDGICKLFDFGRAKDLGQGRKDGDDDNSLRTETNIGIGHHCAPEIVQGGPHGFPVDWWSFGVLIIEMLTGAPPFPYACASEIDLEAFRAKLAVKIHAGIEPLKLEQEAGIGDAFPLVAQLMSNDPLQRPDGDQVCNSSWFSSVDLRSDATTLKPLYTAQSPVYCATGRRATSEDDPFAGF